MLELINKKRIKQQSIDILGFSEKEAQKLIESVNNDLELVRIISPLDLLDYCERVLPSDEKIIRTLFYITVLESVLAAKKSNSAKIKLLSEAFCKHLDNNDKILLLNGFLFTDDYKFGEGSIVDTPPRHLMYKDMAKQQDYIKIDTSIEKYCFTGSNRICRCITWVSQNGTFDKYIKILVERLCEMRGALLHEGFRVIWFPDFDIPEGFTHFASSLVDAHPTHTELDTFRTYESGIDSTDFYKLIKKIIKKYYLEKINGF